MDSIVVQQPANSAESLAIKTRLLQIANSLEDSTFDISDLLLEAHDKSLHLENGFLRFGDWVESLGADISARQAGYYVNIGSKALRLNIDRPTLKKVKISKLKEIFSLDPDKFSSEMTALIAEAENLTLDQVKAKVAALKLKDGQELMFYRNYKFTESALKVVEDASEKCKAEVGDQVVGGQIVEPSSSRLLELICGDYLSGS